MPQLQPRHGLHRRRDGRLQMQWTAPRRQEEMRLGCAMHGLSIASDCTRLPAAIIRARAATSRPCSNDRFSHVTKKECPFTHPPSQSPCLRGDQCYDLHCERRHPRALWVNITRFAELRRLRAPPAAAQSPDDAATAPGASTEGFVTWDDLCHLADTLQIQCAIGSDVIARTFYYFAEDTPGGSWTRRAPLGAATYGASSPA